MMKINFKKKLNIKLVGQYFIIYLFILYWYFTFPPPSDYRAGPIIAAVILPFLVIFTIKSFYHYWTAPGEVQLDLKRRAVMMDSAEIKSGVENRRLIVVAKKGSFSLSIEEDNGQIRGCTAIFSPRVLYGCESALEDLKLIFDEQEWITLIEE